MDNLEKIIYLIIQETIETSDNKYCLVAGSGRNLGCYRSRSGAEDREKQVNYFKWKKKKTKKVKKEMSSMGSGNVVTGVVSSEREEDGKN